MPHSWSLIVGLHCAALTAGIGASLDQSTLAAIAVDPGKRERIARAQLVGGCE